MIYKAPIVMGILNVTPDSFFPESRISSIQQAVDRVAKMLADGADWIDIGAQSTRPGAKLISADEEMNRLLPYLEAIHLAFPHAVLSVDTFYLEVAKASSVLGCSIINDVSGAEISAELPLYCLHQQLIYVAMHKQGMPENMQINPQYTDVMKEVNAYFQSINASMNHWGMADWIIDPGFGFGKTASHNFQILSQLHQLRVFDRPIMVGISRKGMVWKTLNSSPENALNGTTALHMAALLNGASILRVHDVQAASEVRTLYMNYINAKP